MRLWNWIWWYAVSSCAYRVLEGTLFLLYIWELMVARRGYSERIRGFGSAVVDEVEYGRKQFNAARAEPQRR